MYVYYEHLSLLYDFFQTIKTGQTMFFIKGFMYND